MKLWTKQQRIDQLEAALKEQKQRVTNSISVIERLQAQLEAAQIELNAQRGKESHRSATDSVSQTTLSAELEKAHALAHQLKLQAEQWRCKAEEAMKARHHAEAGFARLRKKIKRSRSQA